MRRQKMERGTVHERDKIPVHVIGHNYQIEGMFAEKINFKLSSLLEARVVVFTGGEDVSPGLYGDAIHPTTMNNVRRDAFEARLFQTLRNRQLRGKQPLTFAGICRGGQFLNVMNGGTLFQDVDHHTQSHILQYTRLKGHVEDCMVTSTHHQMMIPTTEAQVWGACAVSSYRDKGEDRKRPRPAGLRDFEIVFYPRTKTMCFQPHPEYFGQEGRPCRELFWTCLFRAFLHNPVADAHEAAEHPILTDPDGAPYGDKERLVL